MLLRKICITNLSKLQPRFSAQAAFPVSAGKRKRDTIRDGIPYCFLVCPGRFELPIFGSGGQRSIQLSHGHTYSYTLRGYPENALRTLSDIPCLGKADIARPQYTVTTACGLQCNPFCPCLPSSNDGNPGFPLASWSCSDRKEPGQQQAAQIHPCSAPGPGMFPSAWE